MSLSAALARRRAATPAAEPSAPPPPSAVDARVVEPPAPPPSPLPAAAPASVGAGPLPPLDLGRPLRGCPVAVIDVETTGIDPREARIVEIAVVTVDALGESEPVVAYHQRVRPDIPIPPDATKVHGISDADVAGCLPWPLIWIGLWAVANTPAPVVAKIHDAVVKTLADPEVAKRLADGGMVIEPRSPAAFATVVRNELDLWGGVVTSLGSAIQKQ